MAEVQIALAKPVPRDRIEWIHEFGSLWKMRDRGMTALALAITDARFFQDRLDHVCGAFNWQSEVKFVGGILMVGIGIRNPELTEEWLWKWDTGQEMQAHTDARGGGKSIMSRGYKRAGYQWGIGRDLYNYAKPRLNCKTYTRKGDGKEIFKEFTQNPWEAIDKGKGESPETGRTHGSRVDDVGDEIKAGATAFYDIAYVKLGWNDEGQKDQAVSVMAAFTDKNTDKTDWNKAIRALEKNLPPTDRLYTIQEEKKAKAKAKAEAEAKAKKGA
jgi:hypothetical protein